MDSYVSTGRARKQVRSRCGLSLPSPRSDAQDIRADLCHAEGLQHLAHALGKKLRLAAVGLAMLAFARPCLRSAYALEGGVPDTVHTSSVGVCIGGTAGACEQVCSGTLIAPNVVLTARHCVDAAVLHRASRMFGWNNSPYRAIQTSKPVGERVPKGACTARSLVTRQRLGIRASRICGVHARVHIQATRVCRGSRVFRFGARRCSSARGASCKARCAHDGKHGSQEVLFHERSL
jgi:hypothetical protein